MKYSIALLTTVIFCGLIACDSGPISPVGFLLPQGDVEQGKAVFLELHCNACHTVDGVDPVNVDPKQIITMELIS